MRIVIGISGASGVIYAKRLVEELYKKAELDIIISDTAKKIIEEELGLSYKYFEKFGTLHDNRDFFSPLASGSNKFDAFVIIPCSMKTLSAIANGYSSSLIVRVADISLKERRKLIIAPREMPFSSIHLENMLKLSNLGAIILAPCPAFYFKPKSLEDIVNFVVGRILDLLNIENNLFRRWRC
ncbi:3-octaprenyl-4-hydroxybenzoate carboxy-lyase [Methanocaldococcus infernus ME]|uniref:Flavin prenyltransferase UbiX n=1 Tax=Methanocaldococcus infernus (strain DSM 11812 / JCM 15783 / ME) TaxID=573063 RepID=D5VQI8_METIM|nr:UbiX family flavin prenyltransferase [Methanocaldococcus infernus]ADG12841.1 3-octaprenyl-4-hydroxybenzoate carboxy-lyase [Methanocaldococcus infernus ME]